jgi:hypothetical protein
MPEWLIQSLVAGVSAGGIAWATIRVELYYLKRAIESAHERLDAIHAPPGRVRL